MKMQAQVCPIDSEELPLTIFYKDRFVLWELYSSESAVLWKERPPMVLVLTYGRPCQYLRAEFQQSCSWCTALRKANGFEKNDF